MSLDEEGLMGLAQAFSSVALDPSRWKPAMNDLAERIGAVGCALELTDLRSGEATMANTISLDDAMVRQYEERIFHINPRIQRALPLRLGAIADDGALIDHDDKSNGEFYDWLEQTPYFYLVGAKVHHNDGKIGFLTANFSKRHGMASAEHHRIFAALSPYVINAIAAAQALSAGSLKGDLITLDALNTGRAFALLDGGGRLMECSSGFEELFRSQATLSLSRGKLVASQPGERARVERFLAALIGVRQFRKAPSPLRLRSPNGAKGLVLRAVPLPPTDEVFELFQPAALLTLTDLDRSNLVRREDLIALFGLTTREAEIAALLGEGGTIESVAGSLEISEYTVRHHLKAVFGKVGVSRQAELVSVVSKLG